MKRQLIILIVLFSPFFSNGQIENRPNWQLSYFGDMIIHPGFQIGYEHPIKEWMKTKTRKGQTIPKYKSLNAGLDFSYYWNPNHHHGFILSPFLNYRRTKESGKFFETKFNLGYHQSVVDGMTYQVSDQGEVTSNKWNGQSTLYSSLSFGFGKDWRVKKQIPIRHFWNIGVNARTPYNHAILFGLNFGIGVHYFIK